MSKHWKRFLSDECGALLVSDWVFLATILVIAVIPSMHGLRDKTSGREIEEIQLKKPATVAVFNNRYSISPNLVVHSDSRKRLGGGLLFSSEKNVGQPDEQ